MHLTAVTTDTVTGGAAGTAGGSDDGYASAVANAPFAGTASAYYVIRPADGAVTQRVPTKELAHHTGDHVTDTHAVGIEHQAFAALGATWYMAPATRTPPRSHPVSPRRLMHH